MVVVVIGVVMGIGHRGGNGKWPRRVVMKEGHRGGHGAWSLGGGHSGSGHGSGHGGWSWRWSWGVVKEMVMGGGHGEWP